MVGPPVLRLSAQKCKFPIALRQRTDTDKMTNNDLKYPV